MNNQTEKATTDNLGKPAERIMWIDSLKGFAIVMVVLGHVAKGYYDSKLFESEIYVLECIYKFIYSFHMPLFITISGLLFSKSYFPIKDGSIYFKKSSFCNQLINLIILYIIYSLIFGLSKIVFASYVNFDMSITDLLLIWLKPIQLYWFLYVLIELYLIFSIKYIRGANKYLMLILLFISSMAAFGIDFPNSYFQIQRLMFYSLFFYIGVLISRRRNNPSKATDIIVYPLSILSVTLMVVFWNKQFSILTIPVVGTIVAVGITLLLITLFKKLSFLRNCKLLSFLGSITLDIYILHTYIATALRTLFKMLGLNNMYMCLLLCFIISLTVSAAISLICKKIGLHDILFRPYNVITRLIKKSK